MKRLLALQLCLILWPPPAGAQDRKLWKETSPVAVPVAGDSWTPGAPSGALSDVNPSAPEKAAFWDHVVGSSFDQLCKNVHLRLGESLGDGMASGTGGWFERYIKRVPFGGFAVVDQGQLTLAFGRTLGSLPFEGGAASLSLGARLDGKSIVIRPTASSNSCRGVAKLANFGEIKTVLPFKAERFSAMQVGEIWKIPLVFNVGFWLGGSKSEAERSIGVSLGASREAGATVSLYRMPEGPLRFRVRLDRAKISGGAVELANLPVYELGAETARNAFVRVLGHEAGNAVRNWLQMRIGVSHWKREGRGLAMELLLDPKNSAQMQELAEVLKGDLNVLRTMMDEPAAEMGPAEYGAELKDAHKQSLGHEAGFTGVRDYLSLTNGFHFQFPLIIDFNMSKGTVKDKLTVVGDEGLVYDVFTAQRNLDTGGLVIPGLRALVRGSAAETAKVAAAKDKAGDKPGPVLIYTRLEGFVEQPPSSARRMLHDASAITQLSGVRGRGRNDDAALPVDSILPPGPREQLSIHEAAQLPPEKNFHLGVTSLTMVFHSKALADAAAADAQAVVAAYRRTLDPFDTRLLDMTLAAGRLLENGKIEFDPQKLLAAAERGGPLPFDERQRFVDWANELASEASGLVADLARARAAATPQEKAEIFRDLIAGNGASKVAFAQAVKVIAQLSDPVDLSGEFYADIVKKVKGESDIKKRYFLNEDPSKEPFIASLSRTLARFAAPAEMTD